MHSPSAVLYSVPLTVSPANAEPLLFDAEVKAYSTSDSPCGPVLSIPDLPQSVAIADPRADQHENRHRQEVQRGEA